MLELLTVSAECVLELFSAVGLECVLELFSSVLL